MKHSIYMCLLLCLCVTTKAQHTLKITVVAKESNQTLSGATVSLAPGNHTRVTDSSGAVLFTGLPAARYKLTVRFVGMKDTEQEADVPQHESLTVQMDMTDEEETEEVIITSTRTSRSIGDVPTRVETISGEELSEKGNMKPGDIRMLLNESTGIQTQQTSATSYNSSIRIQGLDGRYTQVLRDGFPLYAGFAGGLSLMQVAPLDLKQIEVIKGSSSTLYGGGAIAGLVNLVSKTPGTKRELAFMSNVTSAGGLDLSGFYSERYRTTGVAIFASSNSNKAYDPAGNGFTAIPRFERYTINPKWFWYGPKTQVSVGLSYITENRIGGSMTYIRNEGQGYFEKNNTVRVATQFQLTHTINDHAALRFKNSVSRFKRLISVPAYRFEGVQQSTFSEASYDVSKGSMQWVAGANLLTDDLDEVPNGNTPLRSYNNSTLGAFVQNTWTLSKKFTVETGLRVDHTRRYGAEWLPRMALLYKPSGKITVRVGGGLGYKTPTVFNEESERIQFQQVLPIDPGYARDERSAGVNADINYRIRIGEVGVTVNQLFFYTRLNRPLVLTSAGASLQFANANGYIDTKGMETNLRLVYDDLKLFIGYTYADVNTHYNNISAWLPLTARHRLNNVLIYEQEGNYKMGLEAYYFSPQQLGDGSVGRSYWTMGAMAEKTFARVTIFVNFENITDTRQTRFGPIYTGSSTNPVFKEVYAPLDGFVVNGGMKLRL